jgi:hypothetical protein
MNRLLLAGVCAGFVLLSALSIRAQDNNLPAVPKRKFKHRARIISVYDEAKKLTVVRTQWFAVTEGIMKPRSIETIDDRNNAQYSRKRDPLEIDVGFNYPGRVLSSTPETVEFHIRIAYQGVSLFKDSEMPELLAV